MPSCGSPPSLAVLALAVAVAGCTGTTGAPASSATPSPTDGPPGTTLADCSVPETVSPTPTTEPGTRSGTGDVSAGLEITSRFDGDLTVVLRRLPQNVTTFARRYPAATNSVDLGDEMADKSGYWTVIVADCEVVWSRPVYDYEAYEVAVRPNGTAEVVTHVEA